MDNVYSKNGLGGEVFYCSCCGQEITHPATACPCKSKSKGWRYEADWQDDEDCWN